jgi:hypothetical protein
MAQALTGHARPEQVVAWKPAPALDDTDTEQVREGESASARHFQALRPAWPDALPPVDRADQRPSHGKKAPIDDARTRLYQLTGVALVAIPGLKASTVHTLLSASGLDLESPVPTDPLEALNQEIHIELRQVRRVVDSLEGFLRRLSGVPNEYQILSIGGLLHNFYSGVE